MNVKKHCNCPNEKLTTQSYNDLLFEAVQYANKNGKDRVVALIHGSITHVQETMAFDYKIYAKVRSGLNNINDVEHLERPI